MKSLWNITKKIKTGIILSVVACFLLFIYAPVELLFTNQEEFFYDFYLLMPLALESFFCMLLISLLIFFAADKLGKYHIFLYVYFAAFLSTYLYGAFMSGWIPVIRGDVIVWNDYGRERVQCIVLWFVVGLLVFFLVRYFKSFAERVIQMICFWIGGILLVTIIILGIREDGFKKKEIYSASTTKNILELSRNKNFIILLLDAVDSAVQNNIMEEKPDYDKIYEDFTYYPNTLGGYANTHQSIPLILTGVWYENQTADFTEFQREVYSKAPLFTELENKKYHIGVYDEEFVIDLEEKDRFDNLVDCERKIKSKWTFCRWQIMLTGYRYAPFDLKRFCYVWSNAFESLKVLPEGVEGLGFYGSNRVFYDTIMNNDFILSDDNVFKFIHLEGAHSPYLYDESMNAVEQGSYEDGVKASIKLTEEYLKKLREAEVWENTCIIILADHGYSTGLRENPILFVKGFGEQHALIRDDAPISFDDLQTAYKELLYGKGGEEVFAYHSGDYRERRFLYVTDEHTAMDHVHMIEYLQTGYAGQEDTMIKIGELD